MTYGPDFSPVEIFSGADFKAQRIKSTETYHAVFEQKLIKNKTELRVALFRGKRQVKKTLKMMLRSVHASGEFGGKNIISMVSAVDKIQHNQGIGPLEQIFEIEVFVTKNIENNDEILLLRSMTPCTRAEMQRTVTHKADSHATREALKELYAVPTNT